MSEWKAYRLKDFANIQTGPFGSQLHAADYVSIGTPSIMPTNIGGRLNIVTDEIVFVSDKDIERLNRYTVQETDIVYSRRGDVEKCAYITEKQSGWLCGTGCLRIRFNSKLISPKFCAYYLSTPHVKNLVLNSAVGTTMPNLNTSILGNLPLLIPSIDKQIDIAAVLTSLDNKIDLLHRQNETLEALAETLFRQWFIVEADESWEEQSLDRIANYLNGLALQKYPVVDEANFLPVIKIRELKQGITANTDKCGNTIPAPYIINDGDVLFSWSGSLEVVIWHDGIGALNQHLFKVTSDKYPKWFYYLATKHHLPEFRNIAHTKSTTMGHIQRHHLTEATISLPPADKFNVYDAALAPKIEKIIRNNTQIKTLTQLRDTLLPKLMSGEVRVEEVQEEMDLA